MRFSSFFEKAFVSRVNRRICIRIVGLWLLVVLVGSLILLLISACVKWAIYIDAAPEIPPEAVTFDIELVIEPGAFDFDVPIDAAMTAPAIPEKPLLAFSRWTGAALILAVLLWNVPSPRDIIKRARGRRATPSD